MLTGAPPHRTNQNVERIEAEPSLEKRLAAYRRVIEQSPKPAMHRSVPGVDRHLAEIIDRCLAARPARRYENVQAVLEELKIRTRRRSRRPMLLLGAIGPARVDGCTLVDRLSGVQHGDERVRAGYHSGNSGKRS